jgi:Lipoprotein LpqB beta-propeller domain/Sporulation and spore germination
VASRVRRVRIAALAAGCLLAVGGCAAVPISGVAQPMPGTSGQPQQFVQPLPPPGPRAGEQGQYVVSGFLHASASFAVDPGAARAFLAPGVKWHPTGTVTIVSPDLSFGPAIRLPAQVAGPTGVQQIVVTGQRIATINTSGQYSYQAGAPTKYRFTLAKFGGKLLITQLPPGQQLLLTQSDFQEVFQPYNLYFYASGAYPSGALVPDPVYAPVQGPTSAQSTTVADSLVNGLINDRGSWLSGPTSTEFPAGTTLLRPVTISNQTALVDLGGDADTANQGQRELMYAQLKQTLTSSAYSPPVANSVQLAIDGKIQYTTGLAGGVPVAGSAVGGRRAQTLYFASNGVVKQIPAGHKAAGLVQGPAQLASPADISALAASAVGPPPKLAVAVPQGAGCVVQVGALGSATAPRNNYTISVSGGPCTSLSWDNTGSLWAVTGSGIWVLQAGIHNQPVPVSVPPLLTGRSRVVQLRMAPDAVRAAMLVQTAGRMQLYVSAVRFGDKGVSFGPAVPVGTDLAAAGVAAVGWYNPYYLLTVSGSQLYQVPLTGGQSVPLAAGALPAGVQSLTAAGNEMAVATGSGAVYTSLSPYLSWTQLTGRTSAPAFPG